MPAPSTSEGARRFHTLRKVVENSVGITAFNVAKDVEQSLGERRVDAVAAGIETAVYQIAVPLYSREVFVDIYKQTGKPRLGLALFYGLIDIGALGAAIALGVNAGVESGVGFKVAYNTAASAIPEVTTSVSGKIRSLKSPRS